MCHCNMQRKVEKIKLELTIQCVSYAKEERTTDYLMYNTTTPKLTVAMTARQGDTFRRLRNDSAVETWVKNKSPKWHAKYRNMYLN